MTIGFPVVMFFVQEGWKLTAIIPADIMIQKAKRGDIMIPLTITDVRSVPGDSAFLIDDGTTAVLYDTGFGFTGYAVADNVRRILGDRPLDYILLTHSHYDHALGAVYLRRRYPNVQVVAGAYAEKIFGKTTARAIMRDLDRKAAAECGVAEYEDLIDELRADITVCDGDVIECGAMRFTAVDLPGHTKCSVGYYLAENRMLLASESLGIYIDEGVCYPSFLVGYQMTLDSIRKAGEMDIGQMLLPHYGLIPGEEARRFLSDSEQMIRRTASTICSLLSRGRTTEEVLKYLEDELYTDQIRPKYPYAAFLLNTEIMINLIRRELCE